MNIMILNLAKHGRSEMLKELFSKFGTVTSAAVITDKLTGKSKGFGFVEMPDQLEAENAIRKLHCTNFLRQIIKVKRALTPKPSEDKSKMSNNLPLAQEKTLPVQQPQLNKPGFTGWAKNRQRTNRRKDYVPDFPPRARDYNSPVRTYGRQVVREIGVKPFDRFKKRGGEMTGSSPHGGRSYHDPRKNDTRSNPRPNSWQSAKSEYRPRAERPFGRQVSTEKNNKPFGSFTGKEANRPGFFQSVERSRAPFHSKRAHKPAQNEYGYGNSGAKAVFGHTGLRSQTGNNRAVFGARVERPSGQWSRAEKNKKPFNRLRKLPAKGVIQKSGKE